MRASGRRRGAGHRRQARADGAGQAGADEAWPSRVYGRLLSGGVHPAADPVVVAELHPPPGRARDRVRAWATGCAGPGVTAAEVLAATRAVCCGLEIIDSRYADFSFTAADVVADNTSAARIVLGPDPGRPGRPRPRARSASSWRSTARRWPPRRARPPWGTRPRRWRCSPTGSASGARPSCRMDRVLGRPDGCRAPRAGTTSPPLRPPRPSHGGSDVPLIQVSMAAGRRRAEAGAAPRPDGRRRGHRRRWPRSGCGSTSSRRRTSSPAARSWPTAGRGEPTSP